MGQCPVEILLILNQETTASEKRLIAELIQSQVIQQILNLPDFFIMNSINTKQKDNPKKISYLFDIKLLFRNIYFTIKPCLPFRTKPR